MIAITVTIEHNMKELVSKLTLDPSNPYVREMYEAWGIVYRSAMQARFDTYSRGGGDWAPLKESTLKRKRRGGKSASILRDTNTLFTALSPQPGARGQHIQLLADGIEIGFSTSSPHPAGNGASVADIAGFHHYGGIMGVPPQREILVKPDAETEARITEVTERALVDILNLGVL